MDEAVFYRFLSRMLSIDNNNYDGKLSVLIKAGGKVKGPIFVTSSNVFPPGSYYGYRIVSSPAKLSRILKEELDHDSKF